MVTFEKNTNSSICYRRILNREEESSVLEEEKEGERARYLYRSSDRTGPLALPEAVFGRERHVNVDWIFLEEKVM
jgi:hypothetical protein